MNESFWAKKQSWKLSKVDVKKWRSFFVFVRFNGRHFTQSGFTKKDTMEILFFNCLHFYLMNLKQISKNWKGILGCTYKIYLTQCTEVRNATFQSRKFYKLELHAILISKL